MVEIEPQLSEEAYNTYLKDYAHTVLAEMVDDGADITDPYEVFDYTYDEFYEDYPITIIKHRDTKPTDNFPLQYANNTEDPITILQIKAHAVLAADLTNIFNDVLEEGDTVRVSPETGEITLTEKGRELLN